MTQTTDRFAHLTRTEYAIVEIAYMLGVTAGTVRRYTKTDSAERYGEKLLPAKKNGSSYSVTREDLIKFFNERYGS